MIDFGKSVIITVKRKEDIDSLYHSFYSGAKINFEYKLIYIEKNFLGQLFSNGFIDEINTKFNLIIDEYEEEELTNIIQLKEFLSHINQLNFKDEQITLFLKELQNLVKEAIENETGLFFFIKSGPWLAQV